ncbi:MAG TPA: BON domain-containing protein [Rudaea sp.]|jgi:osmotically-inducible protein OsmY|uniref:BON domain-containing protein n=1 Tax=Rudaea sp. TaxID=2136325 RepID=UPI002F9311B3
MKPDRELQQDVIDELGWEASVPATRIGVEVNEGIVTLAGHVESYSQKCAAERAAQRVVGVKGVVLEIDVALPVASWRSDEDLVRAACHALEWNSAVPQGRLKITVQNGWVTLAGEVDWAYQCRTAIDAINHIVGITGITPNISSRFQRSGNPDPGSVPAQCVHGCEGRCDWCVW